MPPAALTVPARADILNAMEKADRRSFVKHAGNPVLGGSLGTCFDVAVSGEPGRLRMDFSWRPRRALAAVFSADGIRWNEPAVTLAANPGSGWEDEVNRNCVLKTGGKYRMWYTGQARDRSCIGYAESTDGLHFERLAKPVLVPEAPFEKDSVMNPCVLYENGIYRMWYAAGETYEPNVIAYAQSADGIRWQKSPFNPVFGPEPRHPFEKDRVGGCQVVKTAEGYLMFYIGYEDIDTACVCLARSADGISGWQRYEGNPLLAPDAGAWDADSCYKPSVVWDEAGGRWLLWYNGRKGRDELIGFAFREGRQFFDTET